MDDEMLGVKDLREMYRCGRSKAYLLMDALPSLRIGRTRLVRRSDLDAYVAEHGGIQAEWRHVRGRKR